MKVGDRGGEFSASSRKLAESLVQGLRRAGRKLALAESCSGGLVGKLVTDVPGASEVFLLSVVAYADAIKSAVLRVPESLIKRHGAVSRQCALAMAEGVRKISGADLAVAVTGIAGPGGGSRTKPVGLVWFAVCGGGNPKTVKRRFPPRSRTFVRRSAARTALWLARQRLSEWRE